MRTGVTERQDPNVAFRFQVEIDGLLVAGFSEVIGLEAITETEPFREGGVNEAEHHLIKITRYPNLVLKRGATSSNELWNWYQGVIEGTINRKNGSIILVSAAGQETFRWNFFESYPVRWIGPVLNASQSEVAIETLEIVHKGLRAVVRT